MQIPLQYKNDQFRLCILGGGTPTTLDVAQLCSTLDLIRSLHVFDDDSEITVEAHPASVTDDYLRQLVERGVNRISFGVQSTNDAELVLLTGKVMRLT